MRIKTQFMITMLLFGVILVVFAISAITTSERVEKAGEQERIAAGIAQGASELSYLANDYLIYREIQQSTRLQSRFASFSELVASLYSDRPEQQALVRNIQANQRRLKEVFDSVVSAVGHSSQSYKAALDPAFFQVSWSRMAVQSQGLVSDASRLSLLLHQEMDRLRETSTRLMYVMIGMFGALLLASYILTYRRILKSIVTLRAGAAVIGAGNLDFTIVERRNDEIGDLSRAFNRMTADLRTVTASKSDLEREVAERKRAEEKLRQQREWLQVTLTSIGDAVIATDTECKISFLNPVAATLTGWPIEEALGRPVQDLFRIINEKTRDPAEDIVGQVLRKGGIVTLANHTALVTRDGREIPIEDSAAPIRDSAGNTAGVVLVFHDVTEKMRAAEALRRSERRYRSFVEVTSQFAWVTDANGLVEEDIPALRRFTGQNYEQARGAGWASALHPDDLEPTLEIWNRAIASKTLYETEYRMRRHDGTYRLLLARGVPILDAQGTIEEWVGTCIDITERKRAEEALQKAHAQLREHVDRLQETNRELEGFSYTISHDLRAPLRAINGFARMLAGDYGPSLDEEGKRLLCVIETNAVKMGLLIDDLLAFSRAGRTAMHISRIDMSTLVADVLETLKTSDPGFKAEIQVAALPPAQGDPALIRQVLVNLLENAVKFSRKRPDPAIEVGSFERDGEQVYFVKDNGVGFDMKYYGKLFGVFQRLVTEKEFEGTGVGLAIVQRLVTRHGGRVWAEGRPGGGSDILLHAEPEEAGGCMRGDPPRDA